MNSMKRQKDMTPEDKPPRSEVSNTLLGKSREIAPERMKRLYMVTCLFNTRKVHHVKCWAR